MERPVYHLDSVVHSRAEMEDFDGPLDLILSLLSRNRMEIQDIQIALILDQYMDWMNQRKEMDLDVASDFVTMAAHLVYIKTRMLLSLNEEEVADEMEALIASLEERRRSEDYARVRGVAPMLAARYDVGVNYITREGVQLTPDMTYCYQHAASDLTWAMEQLMERNDRKLPPPVSAFHGIVGREPFPVVEKAKEILLRLSHTGVTQLRKLFRGSKSRSEVVATFLAVLELCRNHEINLAGSGDSCTVTRIEPEGNATVSTDDT